MTCSAAGTAPCSARARPWLDCLSGGLRTACCHCTPQARLPTQRSASQAWQEDEQERVLPAYMKHTLKRGALGATLPVVLIAAARGARCDGRAECAAPAAALVVVAAAAAPVAARAAHACAA